MIDNWQGTHASWNCIGKISRTWKVLEFVDAMMQAAGADKLLNFFLQL